MEAKIIYFKESGKFYSSAILPLTKEEKEGEYYEIRDRVKYLSKLV